MAKNYFDKFRNNGVSFMDGKDKGALKDMCDKPLHIVDFGFIGQGDERYSVILFAEDSDRFYFGNSIITEFLTEIDADDARDLLKEQPIMLVQRESKQRKGVKYTSYVIL